MSKIEKKMVQAISKQMNLEFSSAYLYLAMSASLDHLQFKGMANYLRKQAEEEKEHAMKFYDYILDRDGKVYLSSIHPPKQEWKNPLEIFESAYQHECVVTKNIHALMELANMEKDYATSEFLLWYIKEQVEEESSSLEVAEKIKMIAKDPGALLKLDKELGEGS